LSPCAGIALASNLGGMTSPISSPQNIFAIQEMGRDGQARADILL
jgi:di/tricarboxylate transporter